MKDKHLIKLRGEVPYMERKLSNQTFINKVKWTQIPEELWIELRERDMKRNDKDHRAPPEFVFKVDKGGKK